MLTKIIILSTFLSVVSALTLPAMLWDSRNLFFACRDPLIRVQMNDRVNIFCPNQLINQYLSDGNYQGEPTVYEKLYNVPTKQDYEACDASRGYAKLVCDGTESVNRVCKDAGSTCTGYRSEVFQLKAARYQIDYKKGNTYYFIGTTSQTKENFNNTKGGSCNTTSPDRYKLRFRVYVCTDEEVNKGECKPCKTQACYYKDCMSKYTPWKQETSKIYQDKTSSCYVKETRDCTHVAVKTVKTETRDTKIECPEPTCLDWNLTTDEISIKLSGKCEATESRLCTNNINGITYTEKRQVFTDCPPKKAPTCSSWIMDKIYKVSNSCFVLRKKTCNFQDISYNEYNESRIKCTEEPDEPTSIPVVGKKINAIEEEKDNLYLYIAIGLGTIAAFIMGLIIGVFCWKHHNNKNSKKANVVAVESKETTGQNGFTNKGFSPQIAEQQAIHSFHFGDETFAPAGRIERVHPATISPRSLGRSVSFHYGDENVFSGPDVIAYRTQRPRRPGKQGVNRHSSAASTTQLMRQYSNVSDYRLSRLPSNELSRKSSQLSDTHVQIIEEV